MANPLPQRSHVVVIGGGVVGCSVAYHLAHRGWTDVLLLERDQLTSGTTWHAAGLVGQLRATPNMTRLAQYGTELYGRLEDETGQPTGFLQRGSIMLASSDGRWDEIRRAHSTAKCFGLETHLLHPAEIKERWPLVNTAGVRGGIWLPKDGQINPADLTQALAKGARQLGVRVREHTPVRGLPRRDGRVAGVETDEGVVEAEYVVNCAGMWARQVGRLAGVDVPLHAAEHFYVVTENLPEPPGAVPVLRDPDAAIYFKEEAGKLLVGMFEPVAKPWGMGGIPHDTSFTQLPEDWDHLAPQLEAAMERVPAVGEVGIQLFFNGPESFTPDDRYLLGEVPELPGFFVACGFNSVGVQSAGGAGRVLADWIVEGHPPMDLADVDVRRMLPFQSNAQYLHDRTVEGLGLLYAMHWPYRQYETARNVRRSPLHDRLAAYGAGFGEAAGWERPDFFGEPGTTPEYDYSFGRPSWFEHHAAEHRAVREDLGLFDQSSFAKFLVQGPDAETALQHVSSNRVDVEPGCIVYSLLLNERGGIESDLTITRLDAERFLIVSPATAQRRDYHWLRRHLPADQRVTLTDITSAEAVLGVMGPRSRAFLEEVTGANLSSEGCPFGHWTELEIGYARVRAARMTYVGELGWELYVPTEFATVVFEALMARNGAPKPAGFHALHSLRTESGYRHWGHDITDEDDPLGAGLGFAVARDKEFIGRAAVDALRDRPRSRRLVSLMLEDPEPLLYHDEPIYLGDTIVGRTTSGRYGHTVGAPVGLGWVEDRDGRAITSDYLAQGEFSVEVAGERVGARLALKPFYDPDRSRVKG
ncbi:MAG: FAD-dependent oxidoreductase [Gammaproteobacteria bacterium]|nr:FAD-dependent oxidoreductase [Gammaproteobacteria bacterium]NIR84319.1 FAD-dependent oxidoreductase [Gammaproteobacteria bacterium]NIR89835.1 FAD-dependent oxidoreductase [Gammaproteobacteria bacterium]NIU05702.1 FAD-dependent oxidoreductase [Gammaproteobacteria bacterium]NIV52462.1 FAD-dependent oxidoreductase [Gammaproteobacteria bacterium]